MILRARCIFPISAPPIDNGAVLVESGRIKWVGPWAQVERTGQEVTDLGEVVLMPGLVNAHCHLDFTAMAGKIPPGIDFPKWAQTVIAARGNFTDADLLESWSKGASMLIQNGTTTVANIESMPNLLADFWRATPLRMVSFIEVTNVKSQRPAHEIIEETGALINALAPDSRKQAVISPHALYSTTPELSREVGRLSGQNNWPITMHLSESESEFRMFNEGSGTMFDWLKDFRSMNDCRRSTPIQLANEYGLLSPRMIAIHANYLTPGDIEMLVQTRTHVVHCPSSHSYFSHKYFPFEQLKSAGVNLCLGTDSLASTAGVADGSIELNLWDEMRAFSSVHPGTAPLEIIQLATVNPARALGKEGEIGEIRSRACADLAALSYTGRISDKIIAESLLHQTSVREVFVAGELEKPA